MPRRNASFHDCLLSSLLGQDRYRHASSRVWSTINLRTIHVLLLVTANYICRVSIWYVIFRWNAVISCFILSRGWYSTEKLIIPFSLLRCEQRERVHRCGSFAGGPEPVEADEADRRVDLQQRRAGKKTLLIVHIQSRKSSSQPQRVEIRWKFYFLAVCLKVRYRKRK